MPSRKRTRRHILPFAAAVAVIVLGTATLFYFTQASEILFHKGQRLYKAGNYREALRCFSAAHDEDPDNPETTAAVFAALNRLDGVTEADSLFERLIDSPAEHPGFFSAVADFACSRRKFATAERYYARSLAEKDDPAVRRRYAEVLAWRKKYPMALDQIGHLQRAGIVEPGLREFRADVLFWDEQYEAAVREYLQLYEEGNGGGELVGKMTDIIAFSVWDETSLDFYREILDQKAFAREDSLHFLLAQSLVNSRRRDEAAEVLAKLHGKNPADRETALLYASILSGQGERSRAYAVCERCLESHPSDRELLERCVSIAESSEDTRAALPLYERLMKLFPGDRALRLRAARAHDRANSTERALSLYAGLISTGKPGDDLVTEYSGLLFRAKRYRRLVGFHTPRLLAGRLRKKNAVLLADAHLALNDRLSSIAVYERMLETFPGDRDVSLNLARLLSWEGRHDRAASLYDALRASGSFPPEIAMEYADVLFRDGRYRAAVAEYETLSRTGGLNEQRSGNYANALLALGRYAEATKVFASLLEKREGDPEFVRGYAAALAGAGESARAESLYRDLLARYPDDEENYTGLLNIALSKNDHAEALRIAESMQERFPDSETALLHAARITGWQRNYPASSRYYDKLVRRYPDKAMYYREKARMLGWSRRYDEARKVYAQALGRFADNEALASEAAAKGYFYDNRFRKAEQRYLEWLDREPRHPEALSDIGRLYAGQARWDEAVAVYGTLLRENPSHRIARKALRKIRIRRDETRIKTTFGYFTAKSDERLTDVAWHSEEAVATDPVDENLSLFAGIENRVYDFDALPGTPASRKIVAGFEYENAPDLRIGGAYGYRLVSDGFDDSHYVSAELAAMPLDCLELGAHYLHDAVVENPESLVRNLRKDEAGVRLAFQRYRALRAEADYAYARYSDGNTRYAYGFGLKGTLFEREVRLDLLWRWREYGFSDRAEWYFTPSVFSTHGVGVELQHYPNREERFRGAEDFWYALGYTLVFEPHGSRSHSIFVKVRKDWSARMSSHIEYGHTRNEDRSVYSDHWAQLRLQWYL